MRLVRDLAPPRTQHRRPVQRWQAWHNHWQASSGHVPVQSLIVKLSQLSDRIS